ncbi:MAG: type II toxin-antitoxin system death-on-curing family toxin [Runella slithyformis]|nr:MAG: type II toxin-antitoxin system death-on-curing family toxin [Runella slithyformis]
MKQNEIVFYTTPQGDVTLKVLHQNETLWLSQKSIAELFAVKIPAINKHLTNIFKSNELDESSVISKMEITADDGKKYKTQFYNLDAIIAVGYRVNSLQATQFRIWATKILRDYLVKGFAINQSRILENQVFFLKALDDLKLLSQNNSQINVGDILELIKSFSHTWFSLDSYDKGIFPQKGTEQEINLSAADLHADLQTLKTQLIQKGEATALFAQEKQKGNLEGIFGNVFQTVFGEDAYPSIEEKAAHLLYFIIKNHPFNDGNKRSGAFAFIWLLQKSGEPFLDKMHPETLATLTILIAESDPTEKDKMIGLVKLLLCR